MQFRQSLKFRFILLKTRVYLIEKIIWMTSYSIIKKNTIEILKM